ncbi:MAG: DUF3090 family protein [Actinomycetota bacterium]
MAEELELDEIDALAAGAVGEPGEREFFIQARTESTQLTVLVEKEQVALLAAEAVTFLDRIADDFPEDEEEAPKQDLREPTVPLFRARLIGLGFDPERERVLIELRERASEEEEDLEEGERPAGERASAGGVTPPAASEPTEMEEAEEGFVARIYATRSQVRAMAARGAAAVAAGRPPCPLCDMPMDPAGHRCPRWN